MYMTRLSYNPNVYGWDSMPPNVKTVVRATVLERVRKTYVIFANHIPISTMDGPCGRLGFMKRVLALEELLKPWIQGKKVRYLLVVRGVPREAVTFPSPSDPSPSFLYEDHSVKAAIVEPLIRRTQHIYRAQHMEFLVAAVDIPVNQSVIMQNDDIGVDTVINRYPEHYDTWMRWALKPNSRKFITDFKDGGCFLDIMLLPQYTALSNTGLAEFGPVVEILKCINADNDIFQTDHDLVKLPSPDQLAAQLIQEEELAQQAAGLTTVSKRKKKSKLPAGRGRQVSSAGPSVAGPSNRADLSNRAGPSTTPHRVPAIVHMRAQEMLDYLGFGTVADYHQVCPGRTKPTVRGSYLNFANTIPSPRNRRDRAIACALLRQRKQHAYYQNADTDKHDHPISLAYAIATAASRAVTEGGEPTNRNWTISDWLQLKGGYIKASEHNIL